MDIKKEYERWLENATADANVAAELKTLDNAKIEDAFYRDLAFGTGGLRGVIGAGTNRMNIYTVAKASQGLADYLKKNFAEPSVAIGYDSRIKSDVFAKVADGVFAANGVMVTASHNPSKYNGYKVYGADGCQITTEAAAEILAEIEKLDIFADVKHSNFETGLVNGSILEVLHERERKALIRFSALERQEEKLSAEKAEIVKQRVALYEQYADGNISKEEFIRQRDAYRAQEDERMEQIQRLRTEKNQIFQPVKKDADNLQAVMDTVGKAGDVMHLSQNVVEAFIDRIEVFNDERVKIRFTFEDVLAGYAE